MLTVKVPRFETRRLHSLFFGLLPWRPDSGISHQLNDRLQSSSGALLYSGPRQHHLTTPLGGTVHSLSCIQSHPPVARPRVSRPCFNSAPEVWVLSAKKARVSICDFYLPATSAVIVIYIILICFDLPGTADIILIMTI